MILNSFLPDFMAFLRRPSYRKILNDLGGGEMGKKKISIFV